MIQRITKHKTELPVAVSFGKIIMNHCYKERKLNHIVYETEGEVVLL